MEEQRPTSAEIMVLNMGPQHPSTHGVLRLILTLDGERILSVQPCIGYLHRGFEKLGEYKTYHQFIPITDRQDYLAPLSNNVGYILAVEKLLGLTVPPRCQFIRVIVCELARISSHLLWLGTHALDLGAATVFFHTFRERETLYDIFEMLTGARMTTSYTRIGGLARDLPPGFVEEVEKFLDAFPGHQQEYERLLTRNRIWMDRTRGIGALSAEDALDYGVTGPLLRASGVEYDVRKTHPYSGYENFDFEVPVGKNGDVYDRYLVRLEEMHQSCRIVRQALENLPQGPVNVEDLKIALPDKEDVYTQMEPLIHHFKFYIDGPPMPVGEVYHAIEAPKGELGYYIISRGDKSAHRLRIRPPSFLNLSALPRMVEGMLVADLVAVVGSLDIVLGEIDR